MLFSRSIETVRLSFTIRFAVTPIYTGEHMDKTWHDPEEQDGASEDRAVTMPELPISLTISTIEQFKAIGDRTRTRILGIIQYQPATAKQIADKLNMSPGTINHHLQVLEAAGLAQIVAR